MFALDGNDIRKRNAECITLQPLALNNDIAARFAERVRCASEDEIVKKNRSR
jgi:hypothetical protein